MFAQLNVSIPCDVERETDPHPSDKKASIRIRTRNRQMDESAKGNSKRQSLSPEVRVVQHQPAHLKLADCSTTKDSDSSRIPKRKLSVFYRSFDVVAQIDQEKGKGPLEFRRTSDSPSVRVERTEGDEDSRSDEAGEQSSSHKGGFVDNCRSLIESGKFFNVSPDRLSKISSSSGWQNSKTLPLPPATLKLPRVKEDSTIENCATITETTIGKGCKLNRNGKNCEIKANDGRVAADPRHDDSSSNLTSTPESFADLAKIKASRQPRSFANPSRTGRLGKYTSVDVEMSSHEESSIGSDSEDDSIEGAVAKHAAVEVERIEGSRSKNGSPSSQPSASSTGERVEKPDASECLPEETEAGFKREKRQRFFVERRSLSEGDCERYHRVKRRPRCTKEEKNFEEEEHCPAFPSFNDARLQAMGLSKVEDVESLYRENIPEGDLERKYIAFSIGLGTDRFTLHRRMALSLRQRDQSEQNFKNEIQQMQEDIQDLCPLCTDQESIDKVGKVRERLDMIERSVHGISCAAETLGAVHQELRISKAIYTGDKYLQLLRTRCENLAAEIVETKQILWRNNIVIEETSSEIGDDLPKIRYRNGLPGSNRTMVARRRASIATISRPLNAQDVIKEAPRCCSQRNSVSGRVTLRRPSLCSEVQRWEHEKLNRADSTSSVVELRDIFEHTESRRNSIEENNNLLRIDESTDVSTINSDTVNNTENKDRLAAKQNSFLESNVTKGVEEQIKSCIRKAEPLQITRNIENWRPMMWYILIFFLGFYIKEITSTPDRCDVPR